MPQVSPIKRHLFTKRAKIMKFLKSEGYSSAEVAIIFNVDRSAVSRIMKAEKRYKGLVKGMLSNTESSPR